jgi:hypothetical protein
MIKYTLSSQLSGKFDEKRTILLDVSVITVGEALGHGVLIDTKTLSNIFDLTKNGSVKAYWRHSPEPDRLGEELGMFSGFHIESATGQLKASLRIFDSFKKNFSARWDYLQEYVEKFPGEIGFSIHFSGDAVWILDPDGVEVSTETQREQPANAVNEMPSVRVYDMHSADLVSSPAANTGGMFSAVTELLDTKQRLTGSLSEATTQLEASAKTLTARDQQLAELTANHEAAVKSLDNARAEFAAKQVEFETLRGELDGKISELSATISTLTADIDQRKQEAEAKDSAHKAEIAELNQRLISFGAIPQNIYQTPIDHRATLAAIKDPVRKSLYWQQHKNAILASQ